MLSIILPVSTNKPAGILVRITWVLQIGLGTADVLRVRVPDCGWRVPPHAFLATVLGRALPGFCETYFSAVLAFSSINFKLPSFKKMIDWPRLAVQEASLDVAEDRYARKPLVCKGQGSSVLPGLHAAWVVFLLRWVTLGVLGIHLRWI